jgi:surface antigen
VSATHTLTRQTLTRITASIAVGAALITTIAATATITAPRSEASPTAATADQHTTTGALDLDTGQAPLRKTKKNKTATRAKAPHHPVKAHDVVALAQKQIGITETNGHGGGTKFQDWYTHSNLAKQTAHRDGATPAAYKNAAWCAMFISWLGHNLAFNDQIGGDAYTVTMATWFHQHHRYGHTPKPGAIVFFDWNGNKTINDIDHVGLVTNINPNGTITTIEGNINNTVVTKTRTPDKITGYGYPDYAG